LGTHFFPNQNWDSPLLSQVAVPVNAAAFKEAVIYHAVAEQKKGNQQTDEKQGESNLEPARLLIRRGWRLRLIGHRSSLLSR
jgi:hypothetical protein